MLIPINDTVAAPMTMARGSLIDTLNMDRNILTLTAGSDVPRAKPGYMTGIRSFVRESPVAINTIVPPFAVYNIPK